MKMQRKQENPAWTPIVRAKITIVSAFERRNYGRMVYRLIPTDNITREATIDADALCPRREYRTLDGCKKAAEKLGWEIIWVC